MCLFFAIINFVSAKSIKGIVIEKEGTPLPGVNVNIVGKKIGVTTNFDGEYTINAEIGDVLMYTYIGFESQKRMVGKESTIHIQLIPSNAVLEEVVIVGYGTQKKSKIVGSAMIMNDVLAGRISGIRIMEREMDQESYTSVAENDFKNPLKTPLSTFSIDVDAASYSNMRRFINDGQKPPEDAVRVEEMINYFSYNYPQPKNSAPFSINYEVADCPWNSDNKLLHIGLQGKELETEEAPASNLVFLIDVSGSMGASNKLPLLKKAYGLLVNQLRKQDRIAIVVYAGSSGLVLPSTAGSEKKKILKALDNLKSGGGTAGAAGLKLAYKVAEENFIKGGNNRIILATDGDFNVGQSSDTDLEKLIVSKRNKGIFISVTGFGMGNYKDSKMEVIADKGNGNYAYIDNILEAKKVFINEFSSTLFTIAKDVKIQIEFNPNHVKQYRLIGYENRLLNDEDFQNDKKDAGELGAGHTVTALYEIVPIGSGKKLDTDLKYQKTEVKVVNNFNKELATVKFRYKKPNGNKSKLIVKTIKTEGKSFDTTSNNFQFSSAVAGFGMLLKDSEYKGNLSYEKVLKMAQKGKGADEFGYRAEFIRLVEMASLL